MTLTPFKYLLVLSCPRAMEIAISVDDRQANTNDHRRHAISLLWPMHIIFSSTEPAYFPLNPVKKAPTTRPGQVKQSGSTLIFGPSYSASRRAEHLLFTSIVNYSWSVIFWTRPASAVTLQGPTTTAKPINAIRSALRSGDNANQHQLLGEMFRRSSAD